MVIQATAKSLFEDIKSKSMSNDGASGSATDKEEHFEASHDWFERFKIRANLHSISLKGEAASADSVACAIPEIKAYCNKENLDFKALILVDNAPGHPVYIDDLSENVKFVFLPPNTTSLIQPMDQDVIPNFKSYYLQRIFKLLLSETDVDVPEKPTMQHFWKSFNILKAIDIISESWEEVKLSGMNGVWRKIWPECVHKKKGDNSSLAVDDDEAHTVCQEIAKLARESNFERDG